MPEGDTVYHTARELDRALSGQQLVGGELRVPRLAAVALAGAQVLQTISVGKHLLTRLTLPGGDSWTLHSHLGMDGSWRITPAWQRWRVPAHRVRAVLKNQSQQAVGVDLRLDCGPTSGEAGWVGHLGPDLLGDTFSAEEALRRLRAAPATPLVTALLDQRNLAGIGNVYAAELCFLSGVDPRTPIEAVSRLPRLVQRARQLLPANRDRSDRVTTGIDRAGQRLWVYGRRGTCLRCTTSIRTASFGPSGRDRTIWWCPNCQPAFPEPGDGERPR